jgi:hypothetical protein
LNTSPTHFSPDHIAQCRLRRALWHAQILQPMLQCLFKKHIIKQQPTTTTLYNTIQQPNHQHHHKQLNTTTTFQNRQKKIKNQQQKALKNVPMRAQI